ncbi:hypothetical protein C0584_04725 [Candidatus Parcubacteria bacterium]|nr:MAG: hypothetical protein C0584_04725 [Candidatus Parcubacteria bacterium]
MDNAAAEVVKTASINDKRFKDVVNVLTHPRLKWEVEDIRPKPHPEGETVYLDIKKSGIHLYVTLAAKQDRVIIMVDKMGKGSQCKKPELCHVILTVDTKVINVAKRRGKNDEILNDMTVVSVEHGRSNLVGMPLGYYLREHMNLS